MASTTCELVSSRYDERVSIVQARRWLREAESVAVITGAGISAESGVPVFRGPGGLWRQYRPEELATPQAFERDPKLVWEWYNWRRELIAATEPNAGHRALTELEHESPDFTLVTQNVDGLHDLAGSRQVLKLHGDIWSTQCTLCGRRGVNRDVPLDPLPPRCTCHPEALLRPAVVWFGEPLPFAVWEAAEAAVKRAEVLLVVGTSAVVYPASGLIAIGMRHGAHTIEVNPHVTPVSDAVDLRLAGNAAEILPHLVGLRR
jgi:NAD-dependent deacetylase